MTKKCPTMSPGKTFILGSKGQGYNLQGTKNMLAWVLTLNQFQKHKQ